MSTTQRLIFSLRLTGTPSCSAWGEIFRDDMEKHFREQLIELWNGNLLPPA